MRERSSRYASWLAVALLIATAQAHAADKAPPMDEEFLEYLGTVDDDGNDWTLFEDRETKPSPKSQKPPSKPPEDDAKSASKQK
jgi:hypothetical protein